MIRNAIALERRLSGAPALLRYGLAIGLFAAALLARMGLADVVPVERFPFLTFLPAVLFAAFFAGLGPGLLASILSILAAWFFFFAPKGQFGPLGEHEVAPLAFFSAFLVAQTFVVHALKTALDRLHQTQQKLRNSEQRLRCVLDQLFVYVAMLDLDGRLEELNEAPLEAAHLTRGQVLGKPFWKTRWWAGSPEVQEILRLGIRRAATGETVRFDARLQLASDEQLTVDVQLAPLRDSAGEIRGVVASGVDVTGRVKALAELEESRREAVVAAHRAEAERQVLDATFNAVPASIIVADATGKLLRMNKASERIWGRAPYSEDAASYSAWKGWWADGSDRHGQPIEPCDWGLARALRGESCTQVVEVEPFGEPGVRRVTLLSSAPVLDGTGSVAGGVVAQVDITERTQIERELRRSQQLLQSTMDNLPALIAFKDRDGRFLEVNRPFEEAVGRSRDELRGLTAHDILPADAANRVHEQELAVMSSRRATQLEQSRVLPEGTSYYLDTTFPLTDPAGEVYGIGHISHDITDRKRAEQGLSALNAQLREADRQKDEFLATLAHELRNPLAPIRNAVELIKLRDPADETVRRARDIIERQAVHLTRLVDDLLDVSRITMGTVQLRNERLDLVAVTAGAIESVKPLIEAAGLSLQQHLGPGSIPVRGDGTRLAQCVVNLLTNAAKFTPRGGAVSVRVEASGNQAVIEVSDDGIGIPDEDLERIFELFVQVQRSGMAGNSGLGIGLALTRKLVALHGGTVRAARAKSRNGSIFRIELPLAEAAQAAESVEPGPQPEQAGGATRVLVVDDNQDAADTLGAMLSMNGYEVDVAYAGEPALAALASAAHDAVLLDIGLPDIDGYEVCRRIRQSGLSPQPVVLALTGWGQAKDRDAAAAAGFDAHLSKPADPDRLMAVLRGQLTLVREGLRPDLAARA